MPNVEMLQLTEFLQTYTLGPGSNQMTRQKIDEITTKNFYAGNPESNIEIIASLESLMNDFYDMNQSSPFPNLEIFDITAINSDFKQLFYTGTSFNRTKHVIYKTGTDVFKYEIFGSQEFVFNIQIELDSIFFRDKRYISPLAIYEYFKETLPWNSIFNPNPMILDNDWALLDVTFEQTNNGYFIMQKGYSFSMRNDPVYEVKFPMLSLSFTPNNSTKNYYLSASTSGDSEIFTSFLSFVVYDYGYTDIFNPTYEGQLTFILNEDVIGQDLTLKDWLDWSKTHDIYSSTLNGFSINEIYQEMEAVFSNYLNEPFVLESMVGLN
jgi:hypothetical protein